MHIIWVIVLGFVMNECFKAAATGLQSYKTEVFSRISAS